MALLIEWRVYPPVPYCPCVPVEQGADSIGDLGWIKQLNLADVTGSAASRHPTLPGIVDPILNKPPRQTGMLNIAVE